VETPLLTLVLLYELLIGKGLKGKNAFETALLKHKVPLAAEFARLKIRRKVKSNDELVADKQETEGEDLFSQGLSRVRLPRYARVNTLKTTVDDVIQYFVKEGYKLEVTEETLENFITQIGQLDSSSFVKDFHLEFLLVFASNVRFHECSLYKDGSLILQDKASCLPPFVLDPPPGSRVVDACAAPGNKTSLLAALMEGRGHVTAFDIDKRRSKTLKKMTCLAGAASDVGGIVDVQRKDFLITNPKDKALKRTQFIVVDPSCSGSGIQSRLNHLTDDSASSSTSRLEHLQDFQLRALTHALSFPNVSRVVYSTCSIHKEENEVVVIKALERSREEQWGFQLKPLLKDTWTSRGLQSDDLEKSEWPLSHCLRASPKIDMTNGFFVALFERQIGLSNCSHGSFLPQRFEDFLSSGPSGAEIFVDKMESLVDNNQLLHVLESQKHMLTRFEKTNEMLLNFNALSAARFENASADFKRHTALLLDMKRDLDIIFRRIRLLKTRLAKVYPEPFRICSDVFNLEDLVEEQEEQQEELDESTSSSVTNPAMKPQILDSAQMAEAPPCLPDMRRRRSRSFPNSVFPGMSETSSACEIDKPKNTLLSGKKSSPFSGQIQVDDFEEVDVRSRDSVIHAGDIHEKQVHVLEKPIGLSYFPPERSAKGTQGHHLAVTAKLVETRQVMSHEEKPCVSVNFATTELADVVSPQLRKAVTLDVYGDSNESIEKLGQKQRHSQPIYVDNSINNLGHPRPKSQPKGYEEADSYDVSLSKMASETHRFISEGVAAAAAAAVDAVLTHTSGGTGNNSVNSSRKSKAAEGIHERKKTGSSHLMKP